MPLAAPLRIDGRLDEPLYETVPPISDFIQVEPQPGEPATDRSEVWITFDETTVFISIRCWQDPDRIAANDMRRDGFSSDDYFDIALDTFYDRRNAVIFTIYASGGRFDAQITDERQMNVDWNPVWDLRAGRFEGGWTAEAAIPFRSLRYRPGSSQIWGINLQRYTQWKNESSTLNRIPVALGEMGIMQMSLAGPLVGLEAPPASRNLEIKPYLVADMESDRLANPEISNEVNADLGVDIKYGVSQNLTADFTYNTDFAQVENDQQQVDLTRFSLFFPEKRDFFLENQGTFGFGGRRAGGFGGFGDTPALFYSRRIGLHRGRAVPIEAGARLTGRTGRYTLGLLNIQSDDEPLSGAIATNFGVMRVKRDILRRSSVGVIYTRRSIDQTGTGRNEAPTASTGPSPSSTTSPSTPTGPKRAHPDSRETTPAIACRWTTTATATESAWNACGSAATSTPASVSSAARTCAVPTASSASARGRPEAGWCASTRGPGRCPTSRTAPAPGRNAGGRGRVRHRVPQRG